MPAKTNILFIISELDSQEQESKTLWPLMLCHIPQDIFHLVFLSTLVVPNNGY